MPVNNLITIRKGTESSWISSNAILASGEPGFDTTNGIFKVGNGSSTWPNLLNKAIFSDLDVVSSVSGATLFNVEGTNGSLFSVVDNLSGTLMSVNNNAGLPVFEVFSDDRIIGGRFGLNDFVLTSGGSLGIGTSSPSGKMDIAGDLYVRGTGNSLGTIYLKSSASADTALKVRTDNFGNLYLDAGPTLKLGNQDGRAELYASSTSVIIGNNYNANNGNQDIRFTPANTERMRITATGIGIGIQSPSTILHTKGTITVEATGNTNNMTFSHSGSEGVIANTGSFSFGPSNGITYLFRSGQQGIFRVYGGNGGTNHLSLTHDNSRGTISTATGDLILSPTTSRVGINTNSPSDALTVGGNTTIGFAGENIDRSLTIHSSNTSNKAMVLTNIAGNSYIRYLVGNQNLYIGDSSLRWLNIENYIVAGGGGAYKVFTTSTTVPDFIVNNSGNVGVGTATPSSKLSVNGTVNITGEITAVIDGGGVT